MQPIDKGPRRKDMRRAMDAARDSESQRERFPRGVYGADRWDRATLRTVRGES